MRRRRVVIFARAPRLGAVKRRLAASIGTLAAWRFQRFGAADLAHRLAADRRWETLVAVTPDEFSRRGRFWPARVKRLAQGSGDLGRRMDRCLRATAGPTIIIGSDIPGITPARIWAAFAALARADAVFGPAEDGGYWLVGLNRPSRAFRPFAAVRWSTAFALSDTRANFSNRTVVLADRLIDVDDAASLRRATRKP